MLLFRSQRLNVPLTLSSSYKSLATGSISSLPIRANSAIYQTSVPDHRHAPPDRRQNPRVRRSAARLAGGRRGRLAIGRFPRASADAAPLFHSGRQVHAPLESPGSAIRPKFAQTAPLRCDFGKTQFCRPTAVRRRTTPPRCLAVYRRACRAPRPPGIAGRDLAPARRGANRPLISCSWCAMRRAAACRFTWESPARWWRKSAANSPGCKRRNASDASFAACSANCAGKLLQAGQELDQTLAPTGLRRKGSEVRGWRFCRAARLRMEFAINRTPCATSSASAF